LTPREQLRAIEERHRSLLGALARCAQALLRESREHGFGILDYGELDMAERAHLSAYFRNQIFPVLTPLAVDPAHPFPFLSNLSLNLAVELREPSGGQLLFARVKVPTPSLSRFVKLPDRAEVVPLEQVVAAHLDVLFPGMEIAGYYAFRVIRDADIDLEE